MVERGTIMQNIGLDIGYGYTKTDSGIIFPSKIQEGVNIIHGGIEVKFNNKNYTVGMGRGTLELNKINNILTKLCMITAVSKSTNDENVNIVTGLPIGQIKSSSEELKNALSENKNIRYTIDGVERYSYINNILVYPQSAGALYAYNIEGDVIIVDIGARTIDVAYFEYSNGKRKLVKYNTLYKGMASLYTKIIELINKRYSNHGLSLDDEYGEKVLTEGLSIFGEHQDLSWLKPVYDAHVNEIIDNLMLNYPYVSTSVYLCGGGAELLFPSFRKKIGHVQILDNSQFSNALGFKMIADTLYDTEIRTVSKGNRWAI